jgi:hypothetical protein
VRRLDGALASRPVSGRIGDQIAETVNEGGEADLELVVQPERVDLGWFLRASSRT